MVHQATHHFDLVNWWLSAVPVSVFAPGKAIRIADLVGNIGYPDYPATPGREDPLPMPPKG